MPRGTPITLKCPKCKCGKWGFARAEKGCHKTGRTESHTTSSKHSGHGCGGRDFFGFRGEVECGDCGHKWFSTHPDSGRMYTCRCAPSGDEAPKPDCKWCKGSGKVATQREKYGS